MRGLLFLSLLLPSLVLAADTKVPLLERPSDGVSTAAVKAASTAAVATDPALVVSVSPNTNTVKVAAQGTTGASTPGSAVLIGAGSTSRGAAPNGTVAGNLSYLLTDPDQRLMVTVAHPNYFSCSVNAATAATQCQAAPAAATFLYITDLVLTNGGTAQTVQLTSGTGTACATGLANVGPAINMTISGNIFTSFQTPIRIPAASALCCKPSGATAFGCWVSGYISAN